MLRAASARREAIQRLVKGTAVALVFGALLLTWALVVSLSTVRQTAHMDGSDGYLTVVVQGCDVVRLSISHCLLLPSHALRNCLAPETPSYNGPFHDDSRRKLLGREKPVFRILTDGGSSRRRTGTFN